MKEIATALLKVQQSLDPIYKGKKGYGYTYADLPAVLNAVVDVLNQNGVVVVQSPEKTDKNAACIVTRLIHADSGEEISSTIEVPFEADNKQKMSVAQAYGSAITYAKRYALVSMLGVATEDDDGASAGRKEAKQTASKEDPLIKKAQSKVDEVLATLKGQDTFQIGQWMLENPKEVDALRWVQRNYADLLNPITELGVEL